MTASRLEPQPCALRALWLAFALAATGLTAACTSQRQAVPLSPEDEAAIVAETIRHACFTVCEATAVFKELIPLHGDWNDGRPMPDAMIEAIEASYPQASYFASLDLLVYPDWTTDEPITAVLVTPVQAFTDGSSGLTVVLIGRQTIEGWSYMYVEEDPTWVRASREAIDVTAPTVPPRYGLGSR